MLLENNSFPSFCCCCFATCMKSTAFELEATSSSPKSSNCCSLLFSCLLPSADSSASPLLPARAGSRGASFLLRFLDWPSPEADDDDEDEEEEVD